MESLVVPPPRLRAPGRHNHCASARNVCLFPPLVSPQPFAQVRGTYSAPWVATRKAQLHGASFFLPRPGPPQLLKSCTEMFCYSAACVATSTPQLHGTFVSPPGSLHPLHKCRRFLIFPRALGRHIHCASVWRLRLISASWVVTTTAAPACLALHNVSALR